jgi:hypothetical protein
VPQALNHANRPVRGVVEIAPSSAGQMAPELRSRASRDACGQLLGQTLTARFGRHSGHQGARRHDHPGGTTAPAATTASSPMTAR